MHENIEVHVYETLFFYHMLQFDDVTMNLSTFPDVIISYTER